MITGMMILEQKAKTAGIELGQSIPQETFRALGLPMVVACTGCETTMVMPAAYVDSEDYTWCADCAGMGDEEENYPVPEPREAPPWKDEDWDKIEF